MKAFGVLLMSLALHTHTHTAENKYNVTEVINMSDMDVLCETFASSLNLFDSGFKETIKADITRQLELPATNEGDLPVIFECPVTNDNSFFVCSNFSHTNKQSDLGNPSQYVALLESERQPPRTNTTMYEYSF